MGDVGDVDAEGPEPLLVDRQGDGVVEVAGRGRVDGDRQLVAEVEAALDVFLVERLGLASGLVERVVVEDVGDPQRPDDGDGLDLGLASGAEDLGDDPFARPVGGGIAGDLDGDLVARLGPLGPRVADVEGVGERLAVDLDVPGVVLLEVVADEETRGPGDDLDDPPLGVEPRPLGPSWVILT